jgi:hypothetical protein
MNNPIRPVNLSIDYLSTLLLRCRMASSGKGFGKGKGGHRVRNGAGNDEHGGGAGQGKGERSSIGSSITDKIQWLETKKKHWDGDKLVYELCGPNKTNWQGIVDATADDTACRLSRAVISVLTHVDIQENQDLLKLHLPLLTERAGTGLANMFSAKGPLSKLDIEEVIEEYGSGEWNRTLRDFHQVLSPIDVLMTRHLPAQTSAVCERILELAETRIGALLGPERQLSNTEDSIGEAPTGSWGYISDEEKRKSLRSVNNT